MIARPFGKYRLMERIAVGGTAEVFRAALVWPDGREEPVVVKKILPQYARDARFRQLFHEEALVIASLQHPNIVAIRDFGEIKGTFFLALEAVTGADLGTLLQEGSRGSVQISAGLAAHLVAEVCKALEYVHARVSSTGTPLRIVHRDISPQNILISRAGEVKLADFGIAQSVIRSDKTTQGTIKGKFDYMSPEQATPGATVDERTDIFALGSVLYRMLFGRTPFGGETEVETLDRVRRCAVLLDDEALPPENQKLAGILRGCLQLAPESRYRSALLMRSDLEAYLANLDPRPSADLLGAWVQGVVGEPAESRRIARELLDTEGGRTAILAARPAGPAAGSATPDSESGDPGPPISSSPPRPVGFAGLRLALLLAVVVTVTVAITLAVVFRLMRQERLGERPAAPHRPLSSVPKNLAVRSPDGGDVRVEPSVSTGGDEGDESESTPIGLRVTAPRYGKLTVNSIPWAYVYVDGRRIGATPIRSVTVAAGRHRIDLRDEHGERMRSFVTKIEAGKSRVLSFDQSQR